MDTALQCLVIVARQQGVELSVDRIKREHAIQEPEVTESFVVEVARHGGLESKHAMTDWDALAGLGDTFPVIARLKNGFSVVVVGVRDGEQGEQVLVLDPLSPQVELLTVARETFVEAWSGSLLFVRRARTATEATEREFDFGWFVDEIGRMKGLFGQVALIALTLHLLAFVPAVFSMIVFDKVVTYRSLDTLNVLFAGVIVALVFNGVLGYLRTALLLHVTGKLDVRVAALGLRRLLSLPLGFFQATSAGVIVKHMQQTAAIRDFFTGALLLTLIELSSLLLVLPVLAFLSLKLTGILLVFAALIAANSVVTTRPYRQRLQRLYEAEGDKQAILVETIHGMETVKSLALEPVQTRRWLEHTALAVRTQFDVGRLSAITSETSGLLMKVMSAVVIWAGTMAVLAGEISLGVLIAFNMLAQRVTGPLVQMVTLVTKYQQTALSMRMLAGLLNRRQERSRTGGITPEVAGAIEFDKVAFRYAADGVNVLDGMSLRIQAGETIGVVGRSGSGKSTMVRLLQGMNTPLSGVVRLDGHDLRDIDLMHLRTHVAVVLQRSFLFRDTVRNNIAVGRPEARLEEIIEAARLAGADRFVEQLPQSYDTLIEEDGANLSGGQKQRLALARSLLMRPRVLVLDEATSALDPESEALIRDNFAQIAQGRTVLHISHRLANLVDLDRILVVDAGRIVDAGTHTELLHRCELYRDLWNRQNPQQRSSDRRHVHLAAAEL
ncbi:MAG: peptidase domain-containing ABC transporter [Burkholderiales bacterium]